MVCKGRIVEIEKRQNKMTYLVQGIGKGEQNKYRKYPGGNGTYVTGGESLGVSLMVKIFIYDLRRCRSIDVYDQVLSLKGKKRMSKKMMDEISLCKGNKVDVHILGDDEIGFDSRQLFIS
jgi:hypothetical protein